MTFVAPAAGEQFASDQIGPIHYGLSKITYGALGTATPVSETNPLPVLPMVTSGGNVEAQTTAAGNTYQPFSAQICKQATVVNDTGETILVQQGGGGVGLPIPNGQSFTFLGISNMSALGVKRKDESTTQVNVQARWEA